MNRRASSASAIAALVLSLLSVSASHAQLSPQWANGYWRVTAVGREFHNGVLCMQAVQYNVTGIAGTSAHFTGTTVPIHGKLNNNVLSADWTNATTGDHGWLTFNFGDTFRTFSGEYGRAGQKAMGTITGKFAQRTKTCHGPSSAM
jgi:hypothetical protein